ncbi:hypothetical protein EXIGLDRAFT_732093 [Exidia glandulosa HHB12029]|uniref:Uncharacterized protein n=1 Tax=Exidia glandulosa HHB12029 TaxID=1314781 RepID=A0A165BN28_EXIGL|nr:hypothetical protein EXIGLDRAFT_732093 [Exidia glandulosa HHB12029]
MPELRELMIIAISILYTLLIKFCLLFDTAAMDLLAIYVDATLKEVQDESALDVDESALPDPDRIRRERILRHQPYALLPGSDLMRGSSAASGRSYVWPQGLSELSGLRLRRVSYTPRAVILDFGLRILTVTNMKTNAAVLKHTAYRIQTSVPRAPAPPSEEPSAATPVSVPAAKTKGKRARKASTSAKRKATDAAAEPAPLPTPRPRFQRGVVWTAYPLHPSSLARGNIVVLTSDEMNVASFSYVVKNTKQVVVGPLEWFGNGVLVQSGKRTIIGICHADPIAFPLSAAFNPIIAQIRGRIRNLYRAQNPGKKGVLPATTLNKAKTQISAYNKARSVLANVTNLSVSSSPSPSSSIATAQSKPRRLHADAKLIASAAIPVSSAVIASPSPPPLQAASLCNGDADTDTAADDAADASGDANTDQDNDLALAASLPVPFDSQPAPDHPVYASSGRALDGDYDDDLDFLDEEEMSEYSGSEYEDNASLSESESGMDFDSAEESDFEPPTKRTRFV